MLRLYFQQKIDEQAIQQAHDNLEQLVKARTAELSESNKALAEEIAEHKKTERKIAEYQKQLQKLASELSISEARERRAIAEELHDYIGQSLAFMKMKLSDLKNDLVKPVNLKIMSEINSLLEQTIQYTRDLTLQISPPVLYELGLVAALEWLAEQFGKKYGLNIEITAAENQPLLQEEVKVVLFKSVNELLNNVVKHANAHQVTLEMFRDGQQVIIEVEDDGDGFELDSLESGSASEWRFGLFSIRERLKYLGGHMEIRSVPGKGTRAMLAAPLKI
jgi:signal transduction histidine kinase